MAKETKCVTMDGKVIESIEKQAKHEVRNFSNMIEVMAKKYLNNCKDDK